jgi:hypothetical protein
MQSIPFPQINSGHPRSPPSIIAPINRLNCLAPELARLRGAILPKSDIDQEIAVFRVGLKIRRRRVRRPFVDRACASCDAVPAAKLARAGAFVVHRCPERDDAFDSIGLCFQFRLAIVLVDI